jgi:hypothetical protein
LSKDYISKTSFLRFEQCPKAFYFYKRLPHLAEQPDADKKMTFLRGHEVGYFARSLFPGGTDASQDAHDAASIVARTAALLESGAKVIYEAGFVHGKALVIVDILVRNDEGWWAYEVKSSLKISGNYLKDAYLQYYVLHHVLGEFRDLFLVTINPGYVRGETLEPKKFFVRRSMKHAAEKNISYFEHRLTEAGMVLERDTIPDVPIGAHCFKPYRCDYFSTCWKSSTGLNSIFNLPMADKNSLLSWHDAGITGIEDIPDELIRKESLKKIREAFLTGKPVIEPDRINEVLARVKGNFAAIDMEIWSAAMPQVKGTKPFEQIPFLVSVYNGSSHSAFFASDNDDPRRSFATALIALTEPFATLLVYDRSLEAQVVNDLAHRFPDLAHMLQAIKEKMVDLFDVFLKLAYYHPSFRNSFSLKAVSTVLLDDLSYTGIESGLEAMKLYSDFRRSENELERETLRSALIDYCNTDTLATYRLYGFLRQLVKS